MSEIKIADLEDGGLSCAVILDADEVAGLPMDLLKFALQTRSSELVGMVRAYIALRRGAVANPGGPKKGAEGAEGV